MKYDLSSLLRQMLPTILSTVIATAVGIALIKADVTSLTKRVDAHDLIIIPREVLEVKLTNIEQDVLEIKLDLKEIKRDVREAK